MPPLRIAESGRWAEPTLGALRSAAPAVRKDVGGYGASTPGLFSSLGFLPGSSGVPVTPYSALQSAAVYACVDRLSKDIGKLPLQIHKRLSRGTRLDLDHPLNRLFRKPNRWQTPIQCWSYYTWGRALRGNGFAPILRGPDGAPQEILPVSPDRVSVLLTQDGDPIYQFNHPALPAGVRLDGDNVLHTRGMTFDGINGVSPIFLAQDVVGLALATQQHGATLFRQGAQINGFVKHPAHMTPETKTYLGEAFDRRHAGVQNAHKTLVLDEGMSFEKVGMTNEDSQFLGTRGMQVIEICRLFGMPPHKVYDLENAHYATLEMSEQQYINDTLMPLGTELTEACERHLLFEDEFDRYEIRLDYDVLLRADRKTRYDTNARGIMAGVLSRNEARIDDGREPNVPDGDVFLQPSTMQPTDANRGAEPNAVPDTPAEGAGANT